MRNLQFCIIVILFTLAGCGSGDAPPSSAQNQANSNNISTGSNSTNVSTNENESADKTHSLKGQSGVENIVEQKAEGQTIDDGSIVSSSFANASGSLDSNQAGKINLEISASDVDGIKEVLLFVPSVNRSFILCSTECGTDFQITLTDIDPYIMGITPGPIRFELFVGDIQDNLVAVDSLDVDWQPLQISALTATRENGIIRVEWENTPLAMRYNLYAATQHNINLNVEAVLTLDNGLQKLAILGHSSEFFDADPSKDYHVLLTGIKANGESGFSPLLIIPKINDDSNKAPTANADQYQINEDSSLVANILENDIDINGNAIFISGISVEPTNGTVTYTSTGQIVYRPLKNFFGEDSFIYQIVDSEGANAESEVTITVNAINDNPQLNDDLYTLNSDKTLTISFNQLLANDSDRDGDSLTVLTDLFLAPNFGSISVNADNSFTYTANSELIDNDSFIYQVSDNNGGLSQATVRLVSSISNQPPIANNDNFQINEDSRLIISLAENSILANDTTPNNTVLKLVDTLIASPTHGQLNLASNGTFSYAPDNNFSGIDQFKYQIINTEGNTSEALVTIEVIAQNDDPISHSDYYQVNEDTVLNAISVLSNDRDVDGNNLVISTIPVINTNNGSLILASDGTFTYTPVANFSGNDSFTYQVNDGNGGIANGIVNITITNINDKPFANDQRFSMLEDKTNNDIVGTVVASDIDENTLSYAITGRDNALFNIDANSGLITLNGITPLNYENKTQHFINVEITDNGTPNKSTVISVTVDVENVTEALIPKELASFGRPQSTFFELTGSHSQAKANDAIHYLSKIYLVGTQKNIDNDIYMVVYNDNGEIDRSFGNDGMTVLDFGQDEFDPHISQLNGYYYVSFHRSNNTYTEICFIRINSSGQLDDSIAVDGLRCTNEQSQLSINETFSYTKGSSLNVFAVGKKHHNDNDDSLLVGLSDTLNFIDLTPASDEVPPYLILDISGQEKDDEATAIVFTNEGNALISGNVRSTQEDYDVYMTLISRQGLQVDTFNNGNVAIYGISGFDDKANQITVDPSAADRNYYILGSSALENGKTDAMIVALDATGSLLTSFNDTGIAIYDIDGDNGAGSGSSEFISARRRGNSFYLAGNVDNSINKQFTTKINKDSALIDSDSYASDNNGIRILDFDDDDNYASALTIGSDSTMWLVGYRESTTSSQMVISAIKSDGDLLNGSGDFTEGQHTITYTSTPSNDIAVKVIKIKHGIHAGKYFVLSNAQTSSNNDVVLSRYTNAGILDTSFDIDGHKQIKLDTDIVINGLKELSTGSFYIYGTITEDNIKSAIIAKLDSNANIDTTFGTNGKTFVKSSPAADVTLTSVTIDSADHIFVIGKLSSTPLIVKLTSSGAFNTTFNNTGIVFGNINDEYNDILLDDNNRIIIAGSRMSTNKGLLAIRYKSDGTIDTSFANSGEFYLDHNTDFNDSVSKILTDDNNIYLIANEFSTPYKSLIVKLSTEGNLMSNFADNGKAELVLADNNNNALILDAALDTNKHIVVAGYAEISSIKKPMLARIKPNGILDNQFNNTGYFHANQCANPAQISSLLLIDSSQWLVAGFCYTDEIEQNNIDLTFYQLLEP